MTVAALSAVAVIVAFSVAETVIAPSPVVALTPVIWAMASPCTLLRMMSPPMASEVVDCGFTVPVAAALPDEASPGFTVVSVAGVSGATVGAVPLPDPELDPEPRVGSVSPSGMKFESSERFQSDLSV